MVSGFDEQSRPNGAMAARPALKELTLDHAYRARSLTKRRDQTTSRGTLGCHRRGPLPASGGAVWRIWMRLYFDQTWLDSGAGAGTGGNDQFGHSKDCRPHLEQVVLGMVLDGDERATRPCSMTATPAT